MVVIVVMVVVVMVLIALMVVKIKIKKKPQQCSGYYIPCDLKHQVSFPHDSESSSVTLTLCRFITSLLILLTCMRMMLRYFSVLSLSR